MRFSDTSIRPLANPRRIRWFGLAYTPGGFGGFIRRDKAQRIGLLPPELDHRRIHYVGNVSLAGARWALLSLEARKHGEELARRTQHVELSMDGDFQTEFAEAMIFPSLI